MTPYVGLSAQLDRATSHRMKEIHSGNFGLIIAYLVPGFIALWGAARFSVSLQEWLGAAPDTVPTLAGFLFGTLAAIAAGLIVNAVRWHLVDPLHYASGVPRRNWNYSQLPAQVEAFRYLVTAQFRYYECYANTMVAISFTFAAIAATTGVSREGVAAFLAVELVLWSASRRTLLNYHQRVAAFLGSLGKEPPDSQPISIDPVPGSWYLRELIPRRARWLHAIRIRRRRSVTAHRNADNLN